MERRPILLQMIQQKAPWDNAFTAYTAWYKLYQVLARIMMLY
jgi:hypothetical protein